MAKDIFEHLGKKQFKVLLILSIVYTIFEWILILAALKYGFGKYFILGICTLSAFSILGCILTVYLFIRYKKALH